MSEFDPEVLARPKPIGTIAILTPRYEMAQRINRDLKHLGLEREIHAFFPGQGLMGHRFRKLYVGDMSEEAGLNMPYWRYEQWFNEGVRCRMALGGEIIDSTCLRSQHATLLQHIIETDPELPL
jgi:hypothetical protein